MFVESHSPVSLSASELDEYLAKGWFRMGQTIFTTQFLSFSYHFYSAIWLRIALREYEISSSVKNIVQKNKQWTATIAPAILDEERELLFSLYKEKLSFEASPSLHYLLYGNKDETIYNTWEITLRNQGKLIGVGYFDMGRQSAEGIISFYHPEYKKYSLGLFLIYSKINYCKQMDMSYFYPGYFAPDYPLFDYKLRIGKKYTEFYDVVNHKWLSIQYFSDKYNLIKTMAAKLTHLLCQIQELGFSVLLKYYEFYNAKLAPDLEHLPLFDYPIFLYFSSWSDDVKHILIVYTPHTNEFILMECETLFKTEQDTSLDTVFGRYVLLTGNQLATTQDQDELVAMLANLKPHLMNRL